MGKYTRLEEVTEKPDDSEREIFLYLRNPISEAAEIGRGRMTKLG